MLIDCILPSMPMDQARMEYAHPPLLKPMRGTPQWSERVLELIARDDMADFKELCDLMGVPDEVI